MTRIAKMLALVSISALFLTSCGTSYSESKYKTKYTTAQSSTSSKKVKSKSTSKTAFSSKKSKSNKSDVKIILKEANNYLGTKYKMGGTSKTGMDCSGLVFVSYKAAGITPPRVSRDQANFGKKVQKSDVLPGDLLFFNTFGKSITHVGIVDHINNGEIFFIHASSSKGVMISSLENPYWKSKYVKAQRILN